MKKELSKLQDGYQEPVVQPAAQTVMEEADKAILNQASINRKIALLQAEKILAQHELAEMTFKYIKIQLFMKYGLTPADQISETGDIIKGEQ